MIKVPIELDNVSCIYSIKNTVNGNEYIGSTKSLYRRIRAHKYQLVSGTHHSPRLQNAFNKYGDISFEIILIEECESSFLLEREQFYLDTKNPKYNVAIFSSSGMKGRIHTDNTKDKIKAVLRERFTGSELRERALYALEFTKSEEAKRNHALSIKRAFAMPERSKKLSKIQKDLWTSSAHREKMSEAHKHYTPEIIKKLSDSQKRLWKINKERYSISRRGKGSSILTEIRVQEIRKLYRIGDTSFSKLGKRFGVSRGTIAGIISGRNWSWVKDE